MTEVDTLGVVLTGLQQESVVFCHAQLSAPWGFAKAPLEGAPFHAIVSGSAWVSLDATAPLIEMKPGDFLVFPHGDAHTLVGEPGAATISFTEVLRREQGTSLWRPGRKRSSGPVHLVYGGGGAQTILVSGVFAFVDRRRNPLVASLPRVLHIKQEDSPVNSWLQTTLRYLAEETAAAQPGVAAVTSKLADILFIQAIRFYLARHPSEAGGWLRGMTHPQIASALALMHTQADRSWTVASLARCVGMSRAGFAACFKELVGQGPIEYLTQWRMHEAGGLLLDGSASVSEIAERVGYRSDVAFSKAFKRCIGQSPTMYRTRKAKEWQGATP